MRGTAGNVNDGVDAKCLLHGQERVAFGDSGYQGAHKRPDAKDDITLHVAMRPGKRKAVKADDLADQRVTKADRLKASVRAKVEHPFRQIKYQLKHVKVRYRGLAKNTAQLKTLFALSNLWQARKKLLAQYGKARLNAMKLV